MLELTRRPDDTGASIHRYGLRGGERPRAVYEHPLSVRRCRRRTVSTTRNTLNSILQRWKRPACSGIDVQDRGSRLEVHNCLVVRDPNRGLVAVKIRYATRNCFELPWRH